MKRCIDLLLECIDTRTRSLASKYGQRENADRRELVQIVFDWICFGDLMLRVYFCVFVCLVGWFTAVVSRGEGEESEGSEARLRAEERAASSSAGAGAPSRDREALRRDRTLGVKMVMAEFRDGASGVFELCPAVAKNNLGLFTFLCLSFGD